MAKMTSMKKRCEGIGLGWYWHLAGKDSDVKTGFSGFSVSGSGHSSDIQGYPVKELLVIHDVSWIWLIKGLNGSLYSFTVIRQSSLKLSGFFTLCPEWRCVGNANTLKIVKLTKLAWLLRR